MHGTEPPEDAGKATLRVARGLVALRREGAAGWAAAAAVVAVAVGLRVLFDAPLRASTPFLTFAVAGIVLPLVAPPRAAAAGGAALTALAVTLFADPLATVAARAAQAVAIALFLAVTGAGFHALREGFAAQFRTERRLRAAMAQADLRSQEMSHRIKNIVAVMSALVRMARRDAPEEARDALDDLSERIAALGRSHDLALGADGEGTRLSDLLRAALAPYRGTAGVSLEGPDARLPREAVTPLALMVHELATNAAKHGALADPGGRLSVTWRREGGTVHLDWREDRAAPVAAATTPGTALGGGGFGSTLLEGARRQLGAEMERRLGRRGLEVALRLPLPDPDVAAPQDASAAPSASDASLA